MQFAKNLPEPEAQAHVACSSLLFLPSLNGSLRIGQFYYTGMHPIRHLRACRHLTE